MMIEERVTVTRDSMGPLILGRVLTNIKRITFDLAAIMDEYGPGGTVDLWYRRPDDLVATRQELQLDGTAAVWDVTQEATEQQGAGEAQFYYTLPDNKGRIAINIFPIMVMRDINT